MEGPPKPLDLDLMTDLKDVIFSSAPPVNRHVSDTRVSQHTDRDRLKDGP